MNNQLARVMDQAKSGAALMVEFYLALECLARHSFMPPHLIAKFPILSTVTDDVLRYEGGHGQGGRMSIINMDHPLFGLSYVHGNVRLMQQRGKRNIDFPGTHGIFHDPYEVVLKYIRKELFLN